MGSYSCPVCHEDVAPIAWLLATSRAEELADSEVCARGPGHIPQERRRCPACGATLERTPPGRWQVAA